MFEGSIGSLWKFSDHPTLLARQWASIYSSESAPDTSGLAYLQLLAIAEHMFVSGFLYSAIITVWLWDALTSLIDEIKAFRVARRRMSLPDLSYILARLLTGGTVFSVLVHAVTPQLGCRPSAATIVWFGALATPFNTFLFLVRADAVFKQNKTWRFILIILWLSTFTSLTTPFSVTPYPFELNGYCVVAKVDRMGAAGAIAVAIFDTAVFVSMTYKILSISKMGDRSNWGRMFFGGTGQVSRTLLLTGQLYYFPVITVNSAVVVVMLLPVEPQYQSAALVADIVFQNIMACRVFRLLRLGLLYEDLETAIYTIDHESISLRDL